MLVWLKQGIAKYIMTNGKIGYFIPIDEFPNLMQPKSITKVRRIIQHEEKKLLPTDEKIIIKRKIREEGFREVLGK